MIGSDQVSAISGVGETPEVTGVRRIGDVEGVVVAAAAPLAEKQDGLPDAADLHVGRDGAGIQQELVISARHQEGLQLAEKIRGNEGPQLHPVGFPEGVDHPVVRPRDHNRGAALLSRAKRVVARVGRGEEGRRHHDGCRVEDVAQFPLAIFGEIPVRVLVQDVHAAHEVDDLVPVCGAHVEQSLREVRVRGAERLTRAAAQRVAAHGCADQGVDRPGRRRLLGQLLAGLPGEGVRIQNAVRVHRHPAVRIEVVRLEEAPPEGPGGIGLERGKVGAGQARGAGGRDDRGGEGEGSRRDPADGVLHGGHERGFAGRAVELPAAVLRRRPQDIVRRVGFARANGEPDGVHLHLLCPRQAGRVILCPPQRRLGADVAPSVLKAVRHEDDEVRLALVLDRARLAWVSTLVVRPDVVQRALQRGIPVGGDPGDGGGEGRLARADVGDDLRATRPHASVPRELSQPEADAVRVVDQVCHHAPGDDNLLLVAAHWAEVVVEVVPGAELEIRAADSSVPDPGRGQGGAGGRAGDVGNGIRVDDV